MEPLSQAQLQAILGSQEAQALIALLQADGGQKVQQAAAAAKAGDYAAVQNILKPMLEGGQGEALARRLQKKLG